MIITIITCLGGQFRKNYPSAFLCKLLEPNMWLLVNHTKPTNTVY